MSALAPLQPLKALYDVPAPAKLNLFLHVTGRRPDGYHLIQSVFMLIDWCDRLSFELRSDGVITRSDTSGDGLAPLPDDDLCVRAARALQAASGTSLGAHITLDKHIPMQAGMGGGSSDAATTLLSLQRLWGVRLEEAQLMEIALSLGADVPFFMGCSNAWVEGIGELLTPIELPKASFLVVQPGAGVSTPAIFGSPLLKRDTGTAIITGFAAEADGSVYEFGHNDLQPVAQSLCEPIGESLAWLARQGLKGRMTGSGSAVFAQVRHDAEIPAAPGNWKIRKCSNLEMHPLAGW
ncbi:MAG: 4-(cytidine 5'-diphospho)-2-C-methyl-D-erythritol kinase [Pseudomonadota bacterium]